MAKLQEVVVGSIVLEDLARLRSENKRLKTRVKRLEAIIRKAQRYRPSMRPIPNGILAILGEIDDIMGGHDENDEAVEDRDKRIRELELIPIKDMGHIVFRLRELSDDLARLKTEIESITELRPGRMNET